MDYRRFKTIAKSRVKAFAKELLANNTEFPSLINTLHVIIGRFDWQYGIGAVLYVLHRMYIVQHSRNSPSPDDNSKHCYISIYDMI
jgi:hypothetical protein